LSFAPLRAPKVRRQVVLALPANRTDTLATKAVRFAPGLAGRGSRLVGFGLGEREGGTRGRGLLADANEGELSRPG
jgi:hypothetical protein